MLQRWKREWNAFKSLPPGKRFQRRYQQHQRRPESKSVWRRVLWIGGALASFAVGVVLMFIPGPAVVFFGVSAALIANQSRWAARALDWLELRLRALYGQARDLWRESAVRG
ncbi:MAG TPA: hypothetical protein VM686_05655 [Polyangiaceae bacterium]|jgi:hypothetical protein|nr:hypothetical protein [Polyangiaceae bacterium]